jgi:hypothetical protein
MGVDPSSTKWAVLDCCLVAAVMVITTSFQPAWTLPASTQLLMRHIFAWILFFNLAIQSREAAQRQAETMDSGIETCDNLYVLVVCINFLFELSAVGYMLWVKFGMAPTAPGINAADNNPPSEVWQWVFIGLFGAMAINCLFLLYCRIPNMENVRQRFVHLSRQLYGGPSPYPTAPPHPPTNPYPVAGMQMQEYGMPQMRYVQSAPQPMYGPTTTLVRQVPQQPTMLLTQQQQQPPSVVQVFQATANPFQ